MAARRALKGEDAVIFADVISVLPAVSAHRFPMLVGTPGQLSPGGFAPRTFTDATASQGPLSDHHGGERAVLLSSRHALPAGGLPRAP